MIYIFDVDGTLTPSRLPISPKMKTFFEHFIRKNRVWLVTGSDREKTLEQVGHNIMYAVERAYQSCGNELYIKDELQYKNDLSLKPAYYEDLISIVEQSKTAVKAGKHIEERVGLINFSTIGRNCTQEQRDAYDKWDKQNQERKFICEYLNAKYPEYEAVKGGQISIDIYERGKNKSQVLDHLDGEQFTFFGDHLEPGGNDYPVQQVAEQRGLDGIFHNVEGWQQTMELLENI